MSSDGNQSTNLSPGSTSGAQTPLKETSASASATEISVPTLVGERPADAEVVPAPGRAVPVTGGLKFWLIFVAMMVSTFLSAIDMTSVSTALPTIVQDLHGAEFAWVGSAFSLGSTAVMPLVGGLAQVFGRRPVVIASLVFFALGSGICGGAKTMNMLIGGRAVQGVGSGGIISMTAIVVGDLVPLSKRGAYMGLIAAVWAVASAIGPPVGGAFSQTNWRWLFYLNLPLTGIATALVLAFLHLKVPQDNLRSKMRRMDWIGNLLIIAGTTLSIVALTWAGVKYPWSSYKVLVPLVLGLAIIAVFFVYEARVAVEPVVPWELVNNRNSFIGYASVFLHGVVSTVIIYYLPTYFQSALLQSPVKSGISSFGNAFTIAPGALASGIATAVFGIYRPQNLVGWALTITGVGLLSLLRVDTPVAKWVGFQMVEGVGIGILYSAPQFPILSSLPVTKSAQALALLTFVRSYSQTWGVTVGATILQNELKKLPEFPVEGVEIAYAAIPQIPKLEEPMKGEVRAAFAASLRVSWLTMIGVSGLGLLVALFMRELKMHDVTDEDWGMKEKEKEERSVDVEKVAGKP
ncbi:hypothetical protein FRB90_007547 [Tulasnella sp. 427]|nr:hypothetical protein FRB90_007547 [Tulasnella sp. 427]